jgi:hypothetical protein
MSRHGLSLRPQDGEHVKRLRLRFSHPVRPSLFPVWSTANCRYHLPS